MAELKLDHEELKPVISEVVQSILEDHSKGLQLLNGKLAVTEQEAAQYLSLNPWQLRDIRLAGGISYHRVVGRRIRYTLENLQSYLARCVRTGTE